MGGGGGGRRTEVNRQKLKTILTFIYNSTGCIVIVVALVNATIT